MATHSSVLAWRIPGTGAWWSAVYGVAQSRTQLKRQQQQQQQQSNKWDSLVAQTVKRLGFNPRVRKIPWRRKWQPTPVLLPRKFHGSGRLQSMGFDGGTWWATAHGVTKSWTQLSNFMNTVLTNSIQKSQNSSLLLFGLILVNYHSLLPSRVERGSRAGTTACNNIS